MKKQLSQLVCAGSFEEMGKTQGASAQEQVKGIFKDLLQSDFTSPMIRMMGPQFLKNIFYSIGLSVALPMSRFYKKHLPHQWKRMCGLAESSGLGLHTILGISKIESVSAQFHYVMGCLSMAVGKSHSENQKPFIAYNHDFPVLFRDHLMVRRSEPKNGYASVQLTYPLLTGAVCGVNEKGLSVSLNHAYSREPLLYFHCGVPPTLMVQELLDRCASLEEATRLMGSIPFACGSMMTLMDTRGKSQVFEFSRTRFGIRKSKNDFLLTLNAYQLKNLQEIEVPQEGKYDPKKFPKSFHGIFIHEHNWQRQKRCDELSVKNKKWKIPEVKKFLADHNGKNGTLGSICRHHATSDTIASVILYPQERRMEVSRGYACQAKHLAFSLSSQI